MKRIDKIVENKTWRRALDDIKQLEAERIFCRHEECHFMDVARIAYIENLEKGFGFDKAVIYAAALVHDIGRSMAYANGLSHEEAGAVLAREILREAGFDKEETDIISKAVLAHRNLETSKDEGLSGIIYRADKKSRMCLFCNARSECKWTSEKMNMKIDV